ncbi:MAG: ATP-binding protein [Methylobacterium sp.]|uniref:ATP-binding protein n=1 Tax=Methylobacterium sp. TaxID=409 RepID=UPI0027271A07|nr:ATP-binding protein [Methylobacterium sp.]MDO9428669.1 ATP-binding protein [Methylobacterium sp.]
MELRHLTMVNWHLFDAEDIALGGHVGILGENRSGKSTILDMIQVVLTGASRSYLRLNAVAGESGRTRSGKRSVHGYCLGTLGEGEVKRDEALTYLALGFEDREGVRPPVSIGLAMAARKGDPSEVIYGRFVAVGRILTTADFIAEGPEGPEPARWDAVRARILAQVSGGRFVNHHDSAIRYVREYMRHLVPASPTAEASAAAMLKAVVNAMTLNHGLDATEFVRGFILEENPIRIGELRASIETYKGVSAAIVAMRRKLDALRAIGIDLDAYDATLQRKALEDWIAKRARWLAARTMNRAHKARIAHARRMMVADREDLDLLDEVIREAEAEIGRLDVALAAHLAKAGRDGLAETLRRLDEQDGVRKAAIAKRAVDARLLGAVCDDLAGADPGAAAALRSYAQRAASIGAAPDIQALREAEAASRALLSRVAEWITREGREAASAVQSLGTEITATRERLAQNRETGRGVHLADDTRRLMHRLESAGMDAKPLCDIVDITDPSWTHAAEALLGRDREAIFVRRDEIHAATRVFKDGRREFPRASLVSLNKLGEFRGAPEPRTFPTVFRSDDRDAMAFLHRRYGSVRLAETLDAFNAPGRALMKDGLYDDGLVRSYRSVGSDGHKIGKAAQSAGLAALQARMEDLADAYAAAEGRERACGRVAAALDALEQGRPLADLLEEIAAEATARGRIVAQISAIDAEGDGGLRDRRRAQDEFLRIKKKEQAAIGERNTRHLVEIKFGEKNLGGGEGIEGSNLDLGVARRLYAGERLQHDYRIGADTYRERLVRLRPTPDTTAIEWVAGLAGAHSRIARDASATAEIEKAKSDG